MPYPDNELLPISALQHLMFCERQWGLIHLEGVWAENRLTAEGRVMHERVHDEDGSTEVRGDIRITRGLRIRSLRLGLIGVADVVEFHRVPPESATPNSPAATTPNGLATTAPDSPPAREPNEIPGIPLRGAKGLWRPFPVEYKRGKPKPGNYDMVQLCAQALCLEEMLGTRIPSGALYYGQPQRRTDVPFDASLRAETEALSARLHALQTAGNTPPAHREPKCRNCSLEPQCIPSLGEKNRNAKKYLERMTMENIAEGNPT